MTAQIILSLSILVGIHEAGHMIAAKYFGMRVEQFSIGFPPKIFGVKYGETEYTLGSIPLGGFVKISGMIDESMDTEAMKEAPKDYEFRSKPAWQRLIVMMGGIIVNVIAGIMIYIGIEFFLGDEFYTKEEVNKYGIEVLEIGEEIGLKTGDKVIAINGEDYERYSDIASGTTILSDDSYYTVDRNGERLTINLPSDMIEKLSEKRATHNFIRPRAPFSVGAVRPKSEAERIGLKDGDIIKSAGNRKIAFFDEFEAVKKDFLNQTMPMVVTRDGKDLMLDVNLDSTGLVGFYPNLLLQTTREDYTLGQAAVIGTNKAFLTVWLNAKGLGKMFKGDVNPSKSLMGPIGIAQIFGGTWHWDRFWALTGMLSMVLAFMNFLPIPALDGGHVMFLTFEIISGRAPSDKFLEIAQKIGMLLLLTLMVFAFGNDIFKLFQ